MRLRIIDPHAETRELVVSNAVARLGRDSDCEVAFDSAVHPRVSGVHAQLERTPAGLVLTHLSRSNQTLLNGQQVEGSVSVNIGDCIRLGYTGPTIEIVAIEVPRPKSVSPDRPTKPPAAAPAKPTRAVKAVEPTESARPEEAHGATLQADPQHLSLLRGSLAAERFEVGSGGIIGREKGKVHFLLDHPHVSRRHARLRVNDDGVLLADLGSANGTHVNGQRLTKPVALNYGDRIDIGPFSLQFDGAALVSRSRSNNIELVARKLRRVVRDRATGNPLTLLHDVNLVIRPREFVCLLGPSGSGKSTLLAMLSGRNPPDRGSVLVNGEDLYANFAALKQDMAVVPQKDVLHDSLAVDRALRYTAELRLPPDTGRDEIESNVSDILEVVGLSKRRGTLIRHLSGGQVKRASLANELMARPSLLFLDEVTSGLDEQTDREMMELFRQVADSGKTVVCITHSLANVEATCHLVVLLTEGGRLAFVGSADEAKDYFGVVRLGDVYRKLGERNPEEWQAAFRSSSLYTRYVRDRMMVDPDAGEEEHSARDLEDRSEANPFRQAWILTRRYAAIWRGDPQALAAMLCQSLLVALLLGIVFGRLDNVDNPLSRVQRTINLLFLLSVSCFWFGCNNAAKELVKERVIYARERAFNLRLDSYYVSKFLILIVIASIQVALLFGIVRGWCGPAGLAIGQWAVLALLSVAGTALGLLISAFARTEEVAVALVPIAVMPQIILAGVIAPLSGLANLLAKGLITVHWGERGMESLLPDKDLSLFHSERLPYGTQLAVVGAHIVLFAAATFLTLRVQSRIKGKN
ncbi:MAG TPA: FHA domain-containing protein [Gemmataceae bacterium]|nr:FHA domain-containing protein [Gemmataceae bacterium]